MKWILPLCCLVVASGQTTPLGAARFLEQAAFGPTPAEQARVMQVGYENWLAEQFAMPETPIPMPTGDIRQGAQFLHRLVHAPDQLRQKVLYTLSGFIVVSANKNPYPEETVPYLQILSRHAFGNYRDLLHEITLSPQMGHYLDLANSAKPGMGGGANENYARELMQLFSIGLHQLNPDGTQALPDGTQALDDAGLPIPAYTQDTIRQVALALTGWTYATAPGQTPREFNWNYFARPMEPREQNHDTTAKSFLGCSLPSGQTAAQDLDGVIDCVFLHPNAAPFIATRFIRAMVTSNPSPAYVARVAAAFADNGAGVRGDLRAVTRAVLVDPEARADSAPVESGKLKEPVYYFASLARALNGRVAPENQEDWMLGLMGQRLLAAPTVFGFYSPLYKLPGGQLYGPEFQIFTPTESVLRDNELYSILENRDANFRVDLSPFLSAAGDIPQLIDAVDARLLYGRMPPEMRAVLQRALAPAYDDAQRVQTALYLTAMSGFYNVQY